MAKRVLDILGLPPQTGSTNKPVVHFIGIGGAGMSGIAALMASRGITVTGSDAKDSPVLEDLETCGITVHRGHEESHVSGATRVVRSSAIRPDNPELRAAEQAEIPLWHRSDALAYLMENRTGIAIAGTHGKTTTTSMTATALERLGEDPSYVIGGVLGVSGKSAKDGTGAAFIIEADESDGSFLRYQADIGVITNVEAEHLDHYGDWAGVRQAFVQFCSQIHDRGGTVIIRSDDPGAADITAELRERGVHLVTFGFSSEADVAIIDFADSPQGAQFRLRTSGVTSSTYRIRQNGAYNVANATAAALVARELGYNLEEAVESVATFEGTKRRFELIGEARGVRVYDDYAHHPTEVESLLNAARAVVEPTKQIHVIFQPHLYSRTRNFAEEFATALSLADTVVVLDVYAARENPEPGITGALISERMPEGKAEFIADTECAISRCVHRATDGDIILTVGAGDVTTLGVRILTALETQ